MAPAALAITTAAVASGDAVFGMAGPEARRH